MGKYPKTTEQERIEFLAGPFTDPGCWHCWAGPDGQKTMWGKICCDDPPQDSIPTWEEYEAWADEQIAKIKSGEIKKPWANAH